MLITHAQIAESTAVHPAHTPVPATGNPSVATGNPSTADLDTGGDPGDTGGDLAATIALLANTLAAPKKPSPSAAPPTRLREPDTFDGLDANKLRVFILQCSLHFQDHTNAFSSDKAKVTYALSFLTGSTLGWFEPALFNPSPPTWIDDWDLFRMELESNFGPFDPVGEAEAEIENQFMVMGSRTTTYFMEFNCLASH